MQVGGETEIEELARFSWYEMNGSETYTTDAIVFEVIFGFLDHVPTHHSLVSVIIVLLVGDEIGLAEELLLVILEFSNHGYDLGVFAAKRLFNFLTPSLVDQLSV